MPPLRFNVPCNYPCLHRFSDPNGDYDDAQDSLAGLAARAPQSLNSSELYYLFNSFLPAGSFEEMAPYVPHALSLLEEDKSPQCVDEGELCQTELLNSLVCWCHVERDLERPENRKFIDSMEEAFMTLFAHWTSNTRWRCDRHGEPVLVNDMLITTLLSAGEELAEDAWDKERVRPWMRAERYLAHLTALDSVAHAAWTLWVSHGESTYQDRRFPLPTATRRRAVEMVEDWLLSPEAAPEDALIWDPVLMEHRQHLYLFPDAP